MRFRHKLSIVLVGLAIVPLAATGVLVGALLQHDQVTRVDNRVAVSAASAAQVYRLQLNRATAFATQLARNKGVKVAFASGAKPLESLPLSVPEGMSVALVRANGKPVFGKPAVGPAWKVGAVYKNKDRKKIGEVDVYVHVGSNLIQQIVRETTLPDDVDVAL